MGIFFKRKNEGGIMDAIRCDEKDFLIWKWRPAGQDGNTTNKENVIRSGSSLTVHPGQAAVFLYQNKNGEYDVIKGPYSGTVSTDNLPILASIVGLAFAGGSPFPAEVYYFNLARNMEIPFVIPYFRVVPAEPEFKTYDIRVAVKGTLVFEVSSQPEFIKFLFEAWGGADTSIAELESKMKELILQDTKQIIANAPKDTGVFIMHFNSLIGEIGPYVLNRIQQKIAHRFGVLATDVLISEIRYDEDSEGYQRLKAITDDQTHKFNLENEKNALLAYQIQRETIRTDADVRNSTVERMAQMQLDNQADILSRMREEGQYAQHQQTESAAIQANLGSQSAYINAHALNRQADVLQTGMENMGQMGQMNLGGGEGQMNPAGMMTGMMMGSAVAQQMGNIMGQMGGNIRQNMAQAGQQTPTPPPLPNVQNTVWYLAINGQQVGPCTMAELLQLVQNGQVTPQTLAWSNGMSSWNQISEMPQLSALFGQVPPPIPTTPPLP